MLGNRKIYKLRKIEISFYIWQRFWYVHFHVLAFSSHNNHGTRANHKLRFRRHKMDTQEVRSGYMGQSKSGIKKTQEAELLHSILEK